MTVTAAARELIKRGIVKPTPVRGRYRFTELGLSLYPDRKGHLAYTRGEVLADTTKQDGKEFALNPEVSVQRVIVEFKSVSVARKSGYTARHTTITKPRRTRQIGSPQIRTSYTGKKSKFRGWFYDIQGSNLTPKSVQTLRTTASRLQLQVPPEEDSGSVNIAMEVRDKLAGEKLQALLSVKLNKAASLDIQAAPIYDVNEED